MTGLPEFNYPAFHERAAALRALGHTVLSPAECFNGATDKSYADYMRRDIALVLVSEAIAVLQGWECSRGATLEVAIGRVLDLPILDAFTQWPVEPAASPRETSLDGSRKASVG